MAKIVAVRVNHDGVPQKTTWEIYGIRHCRGPGYPVSVRYQFVDGHGRRRHFSTKVRAKLERDKAKALFLTITRGTFPVGSKSGRKTSNQTQPIHTSQSTKIES